MTTTNSQRSLAIQTIRDNIARMGQHIYVVAGGPTPRFAYTIGLGTTLGAELILAGGAFYSIEEVVSILNGIAAKLKHKKVLKKPSAIGIRSKGSFTFVRVHATWVSALMLGAADFYQTKQIAALQVIPDKLHQTIDIPNLAKPRSTSREPAWKWLDQPWTYPVDPGSRAVTNLAALRGGRITEAARWEEDEWELFAGAGPDVPKKELRVVPLGALIALDESLAAVVDLPIGAGLWRDSVSTWHRWEKKAQSDTR